MGQDYLIHYGKKGMKWGVIRTAQQLGHFVGRGAKAIGKGIQANKSKNEVKKANAPVTGKKLSEMSTAELTARLSRLDMEKRYKQHMAEINPKKESRVKKVVFDILESGTKSLAAKTLDNMIQKALKTETEDKITNTKVSDMAKIGDAKLSKIQARLKMERKIAAYLNGETVKDDD